MNYRQISNIIRNPNACYEFLEDYPYETDFATHVIQKGTVMKYLHPALQSWIFKFEEPQGFLGCKVGFGRSRLLKMKLRVVTKQRGEKE